MKSSFFYVRTTELASSLQSFININQIRQDQIVSITEDAVNFRSGSRSYTRSVYFFYQDELKFDLFQNLHEHRKKELLGRVFKLESIIDKEERLAHQRNVNKTNNSYSETDFNDLIQYLKNDRNETIGLIFPTKKEYEPQGDLEFIQLLKTLNPEIEIPLSYPIPEEK